MAFTKPCDGSTPKQIDTPESVVMEYYLDDTGFVEFTLKNTESQVFKAATASAFQSHTTKQAVLVTAELQPVSAARSKPICVKIAMQNKREVLVWQLVPCNKELWRLEILIGELVEMCGLSHNQFHVYRNVPLAAVSVEYLESPQVDEEGKEKVEAAARDLNVKLSELLSISPRYKEQYEAVMKFFDRHDPLKLADLVAGICTATRGELQEVIEEESLLLRLRKVLKLVEKDLELGKVQAKLKSEVDGAMSSVQKREMLMAQMKSIMKELGIERDEKEALVVQFTDALKEKTVPEEVKKVIDDELAKLSQLEPSSSEFNVCRAYLEWLTCLPWGKTTQENRDIGRAETILEEDHYGLEDVKERILEHIAVNFLQARGHICRSWYWKLKGQ
ncbi:unnamed protein product [Symbiodinium natans]|uniref:Lon N-terminal domain-containing protein n=1 Tax=Symbiodinium natans TaxID=878477 RepID=A0A812LQA2_9DINO|nr:unnamed protein product [Symbiodinium natans]